LLFIFKTRNTLSEKAEVRFVNFEAARRPDQLLKLAIERLMTHLLEGMTRPSKIGFEIQPPSFDKPFFLPLRPLEQNTASAMAAAIENLLSQSAGGIDIFGGRVRVAMHAVWPLGQRMMAEEEGGEEQPGFFVKNEIWGILKKYDFYGERKFLHFIKFMNY
jgi:hypothetical protein